MSNLLYYSINTELANRISKEFYGGVHFVWCSPVFDPMNLPALDINSKIPPSSSPLYIYNELKQAVNGGDLHSSKIKENKAGLKKGATLKLEKEEIDKEEFELITKMIDIAEINAFKPIIYLIPDNENIRKRILKVPVTEVANPLSREFKIVDLNESEFEIINQL